MKLYTYTAPGIPQHDGSLKIGETYGSVEDRIHRQGHELNIEKNVVWQDAVITERTRIDKILHRFLVEQGFSIQHFDDTGEDTEWIKCTAVA